MPVAEEMPATADMSMRLSPLETPLREGEGGAVLVGETRVSLDSVITAFHLGSVPEQIVYKFPTLLLADVYAVIAYYLRHRENVDAYMAERRREAEALWAEIEEQQPAAELRERLLARRAAQAAK